MAVTMAVTSPVCAHLWRKTAVYTGMSGDHPEPAALGHVLVGTALGVAVHRTGGGGATQAPPLDLRVTNVFLRFDPRQLELLPASDAHSQSVFSKHVRAKLAFLKIFFNKYFCLLSNVH